MGIILKGFDILQKSMKKSQREIDKRIEKGMSEAFSEARKEARSYLKNNLYRYKLSKVATKGIITKKSGKLRRKLTAINKKGSIGNLAKIFVASKSIKRKTKRGYNRGFVKPIDAIGRATRRLEEKVLKKIENKVFE